MSPMTESQTLSSRPPDPPRPLTPAARRQAWREGRVRIWWMLAGLLALIALGSVVQNLIGSWRDYRLVRHGQRVEAEILAADGVTVKNKRYGPDLKAVFRLRVSLPGRAPYTIESRLKDQREYVETGKTIALFIDPQHPDADPAHWTDRQSISVFRDLLVGLALLPIIAVLLTLAWVARAGVLGVWQRGQAMPAQVLEVRQAALAPFSRTVCFTLPQSREGRVYSALLPAKLAELERGAVFWIVADPDRPQRAVVAGAYEEKVRNGQ